LQISTNNGTEETLMETTTQKNTKTKTLRPWFLNLMKIIMQMKKKIRKMQLVTKMKDK
jgi:hypothetical protein